ncbi:MAG: 16S rRNA (uracil(1498)-N(3))-methyltransferase [FCB group bacterium]|nr:16S rRNA (uracil(1498)-N(3))-methyltransferase [FCB group bacterium]
MANEQFFFSYRIEKDLVCLDRDEHHHLSRVLRKIAGDAVLVSDGKGMLYQTEILHVGQDETHCRITGTFPLAGESANKVSLAVGMIKTAHWEILLEKAVELGVYEIFPIITRYTVKSGMKRERCEKIILSAVKQCGRSRIPELHEPLPFSDLVRKKHKDPIYICDNQEDYPLLRTGGTPEDCLVLVGPEGGFHPDEIRLARDAGARPVVLTNRRLRTETACMLTLSRLVV